MALLVKDNKIVIDNKGFIEDSDLDIEKGLVGKQFYPYIEEAIKINSNIYETIYNTPFSVPNNDTEGVFLLSSLVKIHKEYQAAIILMLRGLQGQAKSIVRSIMEKLFIMRAVYNDPSNLELWNKTQNKQLKKIRRIIKEGWVEVSKDVIERYEADKNHEETAYVKIGEWAKKAGKENDYHIIYTQLSFETHHTRIAIGEDLDYNNKGVIEAIDVAPQFDEGIPLLLLMMEYLLESIQIVSEYSKLELVWIKEYQKKLDVWMGDNGNKI